MADADAIRELRVRVTNIESKLNELSGDFYRHLRESATATANPEPMKRWVLTSAGGTLAFSAWGSFRPRDGSFIPTFFEDRSDATCVLHHLFGPGDVVSIEETEVVEHNGILVEARHAIVK